MTVSRLPTSNSAFMKRWPQFERFLTARGSEIHTLTDPYMIARFSTPQGTGTIHKDRLGRVTSWQNGAEAAWRAFTCTDDGGWRVGKKQNRCCGTKKSRMVSAAFQRDGKDCWLCGERFAWDREPTIEHLVPICSGGPDHLHNIVLVHQACNIRLGNLSVAEKVRLRGNWRELL